MKKLTLLLILTAVVAALKAQPAIENTGAVSEYPFPVQKIKLDQETEIAFADVGQGDQTLVFIHDLGANLPVWKKMIDSLSLHYRCIALDLPGHGQSSKGTYDFSMEFYAETVQRFIRKLKLKDIVLAGHGVGGQVAITLVLDQPKIARQLILVAPTGLETFSYQDKLWLKQTYSAPAIQAAGLEQIRNDLALNFARNHLPEDAAFLLKDRLLLKTDRAADDYSANMVAQSAAGMVNEPVFERLGEIAVPTLLLFGVSDYVIPNKILHPEMTPETIAKSGQERIPGSQLKLLPGCGHMLQWECAEGVNTAVRAFVN